METVSAEQFVQAFRRFISRRKQPQYIIPDNAKNLIAASKVPEELSTAENETMEWEFTTSGASWHSGVYERRMVGVIKGSLRKAIGTKLLNNGELITLVTELEAIINERHLVDLEEIGLVLRPGDFLNPGSARGKNLTEGLTAGTRRYAGKKIYKGVDTSIQDHICKRLDHCGEYSKNT
uniref:Integrase catalytic domain-containing protein n=1 Tax=Loa loa TaxID=7209 RepID=A0A1I7VBR2_LOALO